MVRECLAGLALVNLAGCSLVLDFSEGAVPIDAAIDAPYSQEECDYKEPNNTIDTAQVITPADVGPAAICSAPGSPDDRDFYRFTVPPATAKVTVQISFQNRPTGDLDLRITDVTGATTFGQSRGFGDVEMVTCPGVSPSCAQLAEGDYVFEVFPAIAGAVNRYDIALTITPQ